MNNICTTCVHRKVRIWVQLPYIILTALTMLRSQAYGQDFKTVIEIVGKMEAGLKKDISNESSARLASIDSLRHELPARNTNNETLAHIDSILASSLAENARLTAQMTEIKKTIDEVKIASQKVSAFTFGMTMFSYFVYTSEGTEGTSANRFDLERMYLSAKAVVADNMKIQLTTDMYRKTGTGYYDGLAIRIKFAYLEYTPLSLLTIRTGMIPTLWAAYAEGQWKYSGVSYSLTVRNACFSTADIGISGTYALPEKIGEIAFSLLNGDGYTSQEKNRFKDIAARFNVQPFRDDILKGISIAGHTYIGSNQSTTGAALIKNRYGTLLGYSGLFGSVNMEYGIRKDAPSHPDTIVTGNGLSFFGEMKGLIEPLSAKASIIWRWDIVEPNINKGGDMFRVAIFGLTYRINEKIVFVIDYQGTIAENKSIKCYDNTMTDYDAKWFLHTIVNL